MDCSTPGFPVHHQLPDHFTFIVCYTLQTCHLILHDNLPPFYRWKTRRQQNSRQYPFKIAGLEFNIHPSLQSNTWNFRLQITNLPPQRSKWKNHIAMETTQNPLFFINHALSPRHSTQEDTVLQKGQNCVFLLPRNFPIAPQDRKFGPRNWLSAGSQRDALTGETRKCVFKGRTERKKTTRRWKISRYFLSEVKVVMEFCPC